MISGAIYAREVEIGQLRQLLSQNRSFLLHGPSGVGKTLLLRHLADGVPEILYCGASPSSQSVFRALAVELLARKNRVLVNACGRGGLQTIEQKSAVALRGIVTEALSEKRYSLVLDHAKSPSQSFAAAVKSVIELTGATILVAARSEHMEDVGFLMPMFTDRSSRQALHNFDSNTATNFALQIARQIRLDATNHEEVIQKIVAYSKGNPGAIVAMLQMAVIPKYVAQQHVKLSPLYIDFRLSWGATHG
jgi:hypothetical protein